MVDTTVMLDTIGANAGNIPLGTPYVAGYPAGLGSVTWPPSAFARFAGSRIVRIHNGAGNPLAPHLYDVMDIETGALTPQGAAQLHKDRVDADIPWSTLYATDSNAAATIALIRQLGDHYWIGHVNIWLANWNLNQEEAAALVGTEIHGATCIGVQWASPTSNPLTQVPGSTETLRIANIDISVVDSGYLPSGIDTTISDQPNPAPLDRGMLVTTVNGGQFTAWPVTSTDGIHWQ